MTRFCFFCFTAENYVEKIFDSLVKSSLGEDEDGRVGDNLGEVEDVSCSMQVWFLETCVNYLVNYEEREQGEEPESEGEEQHEDENIQVLPLLIQCCIPCHAFIVSQTAHLTCETLVQSLDFDEHGHI